LDDELSELMEKFQTLIIDLGNNHFRCRYCSHEHFGRIDSPYTVEAYFQDYQANHPRLLDANHSELRLLFRRLIDVLRAEAYLATVKSVTDFHLNFGGELING